MANGVTSPNLPAASLIDSVVGNRGADTVKTPIDALSAQQVATGPVADALAGKASSATLQSVVASINDLQLDAGVVYATVAAGQAATSTGLQFRVAPAAR